MRKFLSFLGTGKYDPVYYSMDGKLSSETGFVQRALLELLQKQNEIPDRVIIFVTDLAYEKHWEKLRAELEVLGVTPEDVRISGVGREEALWEDFGIILDCLDKGDEIDFDITYSFRYQPILAMLVVHLARVVREIRIRGIYYGNYVERVNGVAPILNLTNFVDMQDWITNVYAFVKSGRAESLSKWVKEKKDMMARKNQSSPPPRVIVAERLANKWNQLAENLQTCRGLEISRSAKEALAALQQVREEEAYPAFNPLYALFDGVEGRLKKMAAGDHIEESLETVQWCLKHGLIQQAYTFLRETVITTFCLTEGYDYRNKDEREELNELIRDTIKVIQGRSSLDNFQEEQQNVMRRLMEHAELLMAFQRISDLRNDINHAGYRENYSKSDKFLEGLKRDYPIIAYHLRQLRQKVKQV